MATEPPGKSAIILYQMEDGGTRLEVKLENETVWLTQKQMSELFQKDIRTVNEHIQNLFEEKELAENSVIRNFRITAADGKDYNTKHYNLDVVISVGYRVKSLRGTQFRIWATQRLGEFIVKGFMLDDERLKHGGGAYFDDLLARIREIRASERRFYQKITDIYALALMIQNWWSPPGMNRAIGAPDSVVAVTWGVAPCWYDTGLWPANFAMPHDSRSLVGKLL